MQAGQPNPMQRATRVIYRSRRRIATVFAIGLALVFAYHAVFGHNGITAYAQKRSEDHALSIQIQKLQSENAHLLTHVEHLRNDPDAIEHEARERLHYTRPGEVIYTLNSPIAPAQQGSASPSPSAGK
jgi:cell division protein FtsB